MQLTDEQKEIINSKGDVRINAVAGSGKTTTVIEYARSRPRSARILYLAFNKSVRLEAEKRFAEHGLQNVKVDTAHSLAFRHIMNGGKYVVKNQGYKTHEIATILGLTGNGEKHAEYILANHINKFCSYFCNSSVSRVSDLNYLDIIHEENARKFVEAAYDQILHQTRVLLGKMEKGEIEIIHDFYLKKFQLSNPVLPYDYILFDEGQDASPAMLDVFAKQKAVKVIVGDANQQIYGWRFAINSLERMDFPDYRLTNSFRFPSAVADLALRILGWKQYLKSWKPPEIKGNGSNTNSQSKATIARTNLGLLLKAIEYVTEEKNVSKIHFEGNLNSYTYADDGASLYDVLNLSNGKKTLIRDELVRRMKDIDELEDYIDKTEGTQLRMMLEIVKEYGNEIPEILKVLKEKHVDSGEKAKAEMVFSTVHRCKGMEYDIVRLVNDFVNEEKLLRLIDQSKNPDADHDRLSEEINLLYVAVTRARNVVYIPEELLPEGVKAGIHIKVLKSAPSDKKDKKAAPLIKSYPKKTSTIKSYSVEEVRTRHTGAYSPWSKADDRELIRMYQEGHSMKELADYFGRTKGAVWSRIKKLELDDHY